MIRFLTFLIIGSAYSAPADNAADSSKPAAVETQKDHPATSDLNTDASSYYDRYSDGYGSRGYSVGTYGGGAVTGYGGYGGGYGGAVSGVTGYGTLDDRYGAAAGGYDNYGYDKGYPGSYGAAGGGYAGSAGYDGYRGGGYGSNSGYGGYGGYGGNGGINSYYGYNNPSYQGYGHTGYGYYNRRPSYGNIYNGGITPSLVTGYRGYSRK